MNMKDSSWNTRPQLRSVLKAFCPPADARMLFRLRLGEGRKVLPVGNRVIPGGGRRKHRGREQVRTWDGPKEGLIPPGPSLGPEGHVGYKREKGCK